MIDLSSENSSTVADWIEALAASQSGKPLSMQKVQEISEKLFLSPKTVNTYRYRIFEKLNIKGDVELTLLAVRHGMLDTETAA